MKKQLLIFDLDGTLADTAADLATAVNLMRAHYSLTPLSRAAVEQCVGDGIRQLVERGLAGAAVDVDEALALYRGIYREHMLDETQLYPGAADGLRRLTEQGNVAAVLTNKVNDSSRKILDHLGVTKYFIRIIGGGDLPNLKPSPDGIFELMNAAGVDAENTWMIGDHHTDLEAAQRAGVHSGFVTYGIGHPADFRADQTWNTFDELVTFFTN